MYADSIEEAEHELWQALDALTDGNLPFARSSAARAQSAILSAWRQRDKEVENEQKQSVLG